MNVIENLKTLRLIPVVALPNAEDAVPLCNALGEAGLPVAEITFRTEAGRRGIELAANRFPEFTIGAGTVTRLEEVRAAKDAGARFAVAPGTNPAILREAKEAGLPFFPGVCTPSEIENALQLGHHLLKFFPAEAAGGIAFLKAIEAPYRHRRVSFIPTGGISAENVYSYLAHPAVVAAGGSWMVAKELLAEKNWAEVRRRTEEALKAISGD